MTRVKICGVTHESDLRAAVSAGADAVGLLVDVPVDSPREIPPETAAALAAEVPPFVTSVLVTMADAPERAVELASAIGPDVVQIHGDPSRGDLAYLSSKADASVVTAVDPTEPDRARGYDDIVDALLADSTDDGGAGGTGRAHDWERTRDLVAELDSPVVLAGGLTPGNVADAIHTVDPFAVDVASGVERSADERDGRRETNGGGQRERGRKDPDAVASFVANAKRARPAPVR